MIRIAMDARVSHGAYERSAAAIRIRSRRAARAYERVRWREEAEAHRRAERKRSARSALRKRLAT